VAQIEIMNMMPNKTQLHEDVMSLQKPKMKELRGNFEDAAWQVNCD